MILQISFSQDELFEVEEALRHHIELLSKQLKYCGNEKLKNSLKYSLSDASNAHYRVEQVICSGSHAPLENS